MEILVNIGLVILGTAVLAVLISMAAMVGAMAISIVRDVARELRS